MVQFSSTLPALIQNQKLKKLLFSQQTIAKMMKGNSFKTARQLFPQKQIQQSIDKLQLDKGKRKIGLLSLLKATFYGITVKNSNFSRGISDVGKSEAGKLFSRLPPVSHVAILQRLNSYDEEKLDALLNQIMLGSNVATNTYSQATSKVLVMDGSSITLSLSRTKDQLPKVGSSRSSKSSAKGAKSLMKLGVVISPRTFVPVNWQFSSDYDDNQIFRNLVDWTKKGYTYVIDRGNTAVDYLKQFTDHEMYFIQKTFKKHFY